MRVVAGLLRGRKIEAPRGDTTRPTTDKVREAVFNALVSLDVLDGAVVADVFAGSGALGIEALSRGAARCVFVEKDRAAIETLRRNIELLGLNQQATVLAQDVTQSMGHIGDVDILFADPPYGFSNWSKLLAGVSTKLAVLESDKPIGAIVGWETLRERKYGRTFVAFLQRHEPAKGTVEGA